MTLGREAYSTSWNEMGFESVLNGTNPDTLHATAAANMHIVPYVTRLRVERLGATTAFATPA